MSKHRPRIVLFDIDQTLLHTGGAATQAMNLAFAELFGIEAALTGISMAGRSDTAILSDALMRHGLYDGDFPATLTRFEAVYLSYLERTLHECKGRVLAGARELLQDLEAIPGLHLGLATGNFRRAALLKLRHYEITTPFLAGGFGEDGAERHQLVAAAIARTCYRAGIRADEAGIYVIGDTPSDITAAKANAAIAVGVATGSYTAEALAAAGADLVLPDLTHAAAFLQVLEE